MSFTLILTACGGGGGEPELNNPVQETDTSGNTGASFISGTGPVLADGADFTLVTIGLFDTESRPIVGVVPTFVATDTDARNTYNTCTPTNIVGISTCTMSSTRAENKLLEVVFPSNFTGDTINFYNGPADHIEVINPLDPNAVAGANLAVQPLIELHDQFDNVVADSTHTVTLSVFTDPTCTTPGGGTLNATTNPITAGGAAGVFNFTNVNYTQSGVMYIEVAATAGVPNPPSLCLGPITVTNNFNYHLSFDTQPSGAAIAGQKFGTQPVIHILDQFNNLGLSGGVDTDPVTVAAFTDPTCTTPAAGVLRGSLTENASGAIVNTFNLDYTRAPETIYLEATSGAITSACSNAIVMSPDVPDPAQSNITGTGPVAANGFHFSDVSITIRDQFTNPIQGVTPTFGATDTGTDNAYTGCSLTNAAGVSTCQLRSSTTELKTLLITAPVVKADGTVNFINPPDPANTTIVGTSATADLVDTSTITITMLDSGVSPVVGITPTFTATDTGATNVYNACSVSNGAGVSTCTMSSSVAEVKTLTITMPMNNFSNGTATFTAGPVVAANSNISGTTNVIADGVAVSNVTITLRDAFNNPAPGHTPTFSATDTGGTNAYGGCSVSDAAGQSFCTFTSTVAENKTLQIDTPVVQPDNNVDFIPGAVAQLVYTQQPSSVATAGVDFPQQPIVQIQDAFGNVRTTDTSGINLAAYTDAGCSTTPALGTLNATNNPQNANGTTGESNFAGVNYDTAEFIYLRAELSGVTVCSTVISVGAAAAAQLAFIQEPTNTTSTVNIAPALTVEVQDTFGNRVPTATDNVTLAFNNDASGGSATLGGTLTVAAVAGTATFSDINIDKAFTGYTLDATSGGLTLDTSASFDILVGPATQLAYNVQPINTVAGMNIAPPFTVDILDAGGNLVTTATDNVTISFNNDASGGSATLGGTLTVAAIGGTASFTDINIDKTATGYTFDANSGVLTLATSSSFDIIAGAPAKLAYNVQPVNTISTVNITPAITVDILDAFDNLVTTASDNVTLAFNNDASGGSATLGGTLTVAAISGTATFSDINIDIVGTGYTLDATSGALTLDTSSSFDIQVGTPDHLTITQEPVNTVAGVNITPAITVEIRDAGDNIVPTATDNVTLAFNNDASGGSATLGGTLTIAAIGGVATFSDINIDKAFTGYTFDLTAGGMTLATSASFDITPAAKSQLVFNVEPVNTQAAVNITPAMTVEIQDAFGNVTADTDNITLAFNNDASGGSATLGGTLNVAAVSGTATFSDINIDVAGIGYTLDATAGGLSTATSTTFDITVGAATQLVITQEPSNAVAGVVNAPNITVEFRDAGNNLVNTETSNVTLAFNNDASGGSATLGGTLTVAAIAGVATFNDITIDKAFTGYTLDATSGGLTLDTSTSFDITPAAKSQLAFSVEPVNTVATSNITPAIVVQIQDAFGNVTADTDSITLAINNNAGGSTLGGTLNVAAVAGSATFSDINLDKIGTGYTLDATAGGLSTATSTTFDITLGAATQVVFVTQPTNANSTDNIAPAITVEFRDAGDNLVNTETSNVTLAFANDASGGSATLGGTLTVAAIAGVATFNDINIDSAATGYTLDASSGALTNDTSSSFDINVGPVTQVAFAQEPSNAVAGIVNAPNITVEFRDAGNNLVNTETSNVTLAFANDASGGSATLGGTLTVAAIAGVAIFNDITVDKAFTGYTLDASSGALTNDTSASFDITPAAKTQLVFNVEPTDAQSGANIAPAIVVEIHDAFGNITADTDSITLAINNNPGGSTLGGTLVVAATAGSATFSNINLDKVGTGYTLDATAGGLSTATSASFNIDPAAATKVVFVNQPTNATAGVDISPSITVEFRDTNDNLVNTETSNVTLAFANDASGGSATLGGTLTLAAIAGVATFNDIDVDKAFTGYTLDASSGALTNDTSSSFDITPAAKSQLVFTVEPTDQQHSTSIAPAIEVEIQDAFGNKTADTDNITLAINNNPGGSTLGGTLVIAAVAGSASFSDITLDNVGTGYTLDATSGGVSTATSASFNITAGPAAKVAFVTQPTNANTGANISPAITVEIRDASDNLVTTATDNVTLAFANDASGGSATLGGTLTVAASGGTATFSNINIDEGATGYTLDASSGALTNDTSSAFNIISVPNITSLIEPVDATYAQSGKILFQVNFTESVTVTGFPRIAIDVGGSAEFATYTTGSGSSGIEFEYEVQAGDNDANGITVTNTTIQLNSGTINATVGGAAADLNFSAFLDSLTGVLVDTSGGITAPDQVTGVTTAPTVNNTELAVAWSVPNDNGTAIINYSVQFREQGQSTWQNKTPAPTTNSTTIGGLSAGVTYELRVAANNGILGAFSAISTAEIFDVLSLNPIAWLSATDITNGGTEPNNNDKVATWADLTGAASDATEGTPANQPTYETNVQNGLPAVRFVNHAVGLQGTFNRSVGTNLTFIVVGQFDTGSVDKCIFEFDGGGGARGFFIDRRYASNTFYSPASTKGSFTMWRIEDTGTNAIVTENSSTTLFNGATLFNTDFTGTGNYVLGDDTTGGNAMTGYIGEFLVFDRALNASEINTLETYMRNKWNLP